MSEEHAGHGEGHSPAHGDDHGGSTIKPYLVVFGALSIFTALSFLVYARLDREYSFVIILTIAVVKATLVGMYFMHLLLDWKKVYILVVPALVLGPMLVVVLLPDMVFGWLTAP